MTDTSKLDQIIADSLALPRAEVHVAAYGETATWDSVAHLILMNTIEERLGIQLDGEDVSRMTDYDSIRRTLTERYDVDVDG